MLDNIMSRKVAFTKRASPAAIQALSDVFDTLQLLLKDQWELLDTFATNEPTITPPTQEAFPSSSLSFHKFLNGAANFSELTNLASRPAAK